METLDRPPAPARHRLTVDEYHRMDEACVFGPEARNELIEGEVIDMATIGTRHGSAVKLLTEALVVAVGKRATVSVQDPLRLGDDSMPQPDLMLLKRRADFYRETDPTAADALLIIEVADSSARYDREIKLPLYARHAIQEVWIIDLDARLARFFRKPKRGAYTDITAAETPGPTPIVALAGVTIDLSGVLG